MKLWPTHHEMNVLAVHVARRCKFQSNFCLPILQCPTQDSDGKNGVGINMTASNAHLEHVKLAANCVGKRSPGAWGLNVESCKKGQKSWKTLVQNSCVEEWNAVFGIQLSCWRGWHRAQVESFQHTEVKEHGTTCLTWLVELMQLEGGLDYEALTQFLWIL